MPRLSLQKNSFTAGEISPLLLGRGDLRAYDNGAGRLRNVFIHPTGGISRRAGLRYVARAPGRGRLIAFEFNTEQIYLLVFTNLKMDIYRNEVKMATVAAPWTETQIGQINWVQSADTLLIVHPDVQPRKITRTSDTEWTINTWSFLEANGRINQPHHKFAADGVTLTPSATTGTVTLTASAAAFAAGHAGARLRLQNKEVEVTTITSATQATATVKETLVSTAAVTDWEEQSFSSVRGWPVAVCFHQDRMVIGGSRDLPNRLWLSKSTDLFNFDLGSGLDDEGIEFAILSDQVNAIRAVFSGRHLQVFTSGAEWMVSGDPLTPTSLQLHRQTKIGSAVDRTVPPRDVDGATLFVPRTGRELREFIFTDVEQAYQATDLAMLARHLINNPVDQDFDKSARLFHMVMADGTLATLTIYRAEQVTAWTLQETSGFFRSIAVAGGGTYVLVERTNGFFIEIFDENLDVDSGLTGTGAAPKTTWSGLGHLEGETVKVLADGAVRADEIVVGGAITLAEAAGSVQVGLGFVHEVEPLPPFIQATGGGTQGGRVRLIALTLRLRETAALSLDTGRGYREIPFKRFGAGVLDSSPPKFSGDKKIRALGWKKDGTKPLWSIKQSTPLSFTLLSVSAEINANA
ncbi:MAG TPA: hypothetical protein ENI55_06550 [Alphaproteobacteria bacterium]|nr:hypothetical protein [Alphaproteobacteria bacterium]